jgi:hypothetical protein
LHKAIKQFKLLNNPHYKNIGTDLSFTYEPDATDEVFLQFDNGAQARKKRALILSTQAN